MCLPKTRGADLDRKINKGEVPSISSGSDSVPLLSVLSGFPEEEPSDICQTVISLLKQPPRPTVKLTTLNLTERET